MATGRSSGTSATTVASPSPKPGRDARLVQQVWNRGPDGVVHRGRDAEATFKKLKDALTKNPRCRSPCHSEPAFYAEQQEVMAHAHQRRGRGFRDHDGARGHFRGGEHAQSRSRAACARSPRCAPWASAPRRWSSRCSSRPCCSAPRRVAGWRPRLCVPERHAEFDDEFPDVQPDHLRVHRDPGLMVMGIIYGLVLRFLRVPAGHPGRALPITRVCASCDEGLHGCPISWRWLWPAPLRLRWRRRHRLGGHRRAHSVRVLHQRCARAEQHVDVAQAQAGVKAKKSGVTDAADARVLSRADALPAGPSPHRHAEIRRPRMPSTTVATKSTTPSVRCRKCRWASTKPPRTA